MNKEKFLAKGVARKFENGEVLFNVESLHEHYEGINYHLTDILEGGFIRPNDVFGADIREVEVKEEETPLFSGMTFEEAEKLMDIGELIALPEWGGFWFKSVKTGKTIVLTKDSEITETPWEEFKERNDWVTVEATPEQKEIIENYFATNEPPVEEIEVIEPEVVEPEIVAPEVIVAETPNEETETEKQ